MSSIVRALKYLSRWFVTNAVIGIVIAFILGVLSGYVLRGMGLPDLFWRSAAWPSFWGGFGVSILFLVAAFVGFLLQVRDDPDTPLKFRVYAAHTLPLLYALVIVFAFFQKGYAWALIAGLVVALPLLFLTRLSYKVAKKVDAKPGTRVQRAVTRSGGNASDTPYHWQASFVFAAVFAVYLVLAIVPPRASAAACICVLLILIVMAYGLIYFLFPKQRMGAVYVLIAIALAANVRGFRYRYPALDPFYPEPRPISTKKAFRSIPDTPNITRNTIIIATSGGGIRATAWTSEVLERLQSRNPNFARSVRIITGASGGMVAAADFVARRAKGEPSNGHMTTIADNALDAVTANLALRDVPKLFIPGAWADRGVALEERWIEQSKWMKGTLNDLRDQEARGEIPSLIFTPAIAEDGRRLIISNLDLPYLTDTGRETVDAVHLFHVFPEAQNMLPLASAARMNATFPYVSPAAQLPVEPHRHLVDAGYFDNFGVSVAVPWLAHHTIEPGAHVMVVELRDGAYSGTASDAARPGTDRVIDYAGGPLAPLLAVLNVVFRGIIFRNDRGLAAIAQPPNVQVVVIENKGDKGQALSWALTGEERVQIRKAVDAQEDNLKRVLAFVPTPAPPSRAP